MFDSALINCKNYYIILNLNKFIKNIQSNCPRRNTWPKLMKVALLLKFNDLGSECFKRNKQIWLGSMAWSCVKYSYIITVYEQWFKCHNIFFSCCPLLFKKGDFFSGVIEILGTSQRGQLKLAIRNHGNGNYMIPNLNRVKYHITRYIFLFTYFTHLKYYFIFK